MIKSNLIHLSYNFWGDRPHPEPESWPKHLRHLTQYWEAKPALRFDEGLWRKLLQEMQKERFNQIVLDLGDAVRWKSHPEIAIEGAWTPEKLRKECQRAQDHGLTVVPKLNFSTGHDVWLGEYARSVSTKKYYEVAQDLLRETGEIFQGPAWIHLGMDEEDYGNQRLYEYAIVRQGELWWKDLFFLFEAVEKTGARPWIWGDRVRHFPGEVSRRMPKRVLQSNWTYGPDFKKPFFRNRVKEYNWNAAKAFLDLDRLGFEQIPCGGNWIYPDNMRDLVRFSLKNLAREKCLGFIATSWVPTLQACEAIHMENIRKAGEAFCEIS